MNPTAWATALTNPYALIGFALLMLSILVMVPVARVKFQRASLAFFWGAVAFVIVAMVVFLFIEGDKNFTKKGESAMFMHQSGFNSVQIVGGNGNAVIGNQNAPINININKNHE